MIALYLLPPTVLKKITSAQYILPVNTDGYEQMNVCMYVCVFTVILQILIRDFQSLFDQSIVYFVLLSFLASKIVLQCPRNPQSSSCAACESS